MAHQTQRRFIIAAAVLFLLVSSYLCVARLYSAPFLRETKNDKHPSSPPPPPPPPPPPKPVHVQLTDADLPMTYGSFNRPNMDGLTLMASLPKELVPTFENKRRLVIVGDIHGMDAELEELLNKVVFDLNKDHLVATGDMINKGPDSPGVVSRLMRLNASAVRGNHEDRILLSLAEAETNEGAAKALSSDHADSRRGESEFLATGRKLSREQVQWLAKLPVILAVEPLRMFVAHAGLVPGVRPELQDPWAVMNMRTLIYPREELRKEELGKHKSKAKAQSDDTSNDDDDDDEALPSPPSPSPSPPTDQTPSDPDAEEQGETLESIEQVDAYTDRQIAIPIEGRDGEKWAKAWNHFQRRLKKSHRYTVVYGHDAHRGFRQGRYTFGLDSGCVKGGALTALVVEGKEGGKGFAHTVVQVHCKEAKS